MNAIVFAPRKLFLLALLSLLLGCINYYFFEPRIYLFTLLPLPPEKIYHIPNLVIRRFMTGYFSDICWCCALYFVTVALSRLNYLHSSGKIIILLLPFLVEVAQYFHFMPGIFDWFDLLAYGIILIVFIRTFHIVKSTDHDKEQV